MSSPRSRVSLVYLLHLSWMDCCGLADLQDGTSRCALPLKDNSCCDSCVALRRKADRLGASQESCRQAGQQWHRWTPAPASCGATSCAGRAFSCSVSYLIKLPPGYAQFQGMSKVLDKHQLWRDTTDSTEYYMYIICLSSLKIIGWITTIWLWLIVFRHLAKYTVCDSCFFYFKNVYICTIVLVCWYKYEK